MSDNIHISKSVAIWLIRYGRRLVSDGIGSDWHPSETAPPIDDGMGSFPGFVDGMDTSSDTWMWAQELINFARTVAAIAYQQLQEDIENGDPDDTITL